MAQDIIIKADTAQEMLLLFFAYVTGQLDGNVSNYTEGTSKSPDDVRVCGFVEIVFLSRNHAQKGGHGEAYSKVRNLRKNTFQSFKMSEGTPKPHQMTTFRC